MSDEGFRYYHFLPILLVLNMTHFNHRHCCCLSMSDSTVAAFGGATFMFVSEM